MTRDARCLGWRWFFLRGLGLMQLMTKIAADGGFEPFGIMVW
jgi:hypothetical protein